VQGTSVERPTCRAKFQGWECVGDVGRCAAVTDGDG
jgi:hypothetical protein